MATESTPAKVATSSPHASAHSKDHGAPSSSSSSSPSSWSYLSAAAVGLLSSSCCVIQLVLNMFHRLRRVLHPHPTAPSLHHHLCRPHLYTVYKYRWSSRTAITLALTLFLTSTPEMVALHNQSALKALSWNTPSSPTLFESIHQLYYNNPFRAPASMPNPPAWSHPNTQQPQQKQQCQDATDPQAIQKQELPLGSKDFQTNDKPLIRYELSVDGMACEACANRLRHHFAHREGIERVSVFFTEKKLVLWTRSGVSAALMLTEERIREMVREVDDKYSVRLLDMYSS
ncbi:unnamed protein product [Mortierella alpina]